MGRRSPVFWDEKYSLEGLMTQKISDVISVEDFYAEFYERLTHIAETYLGIGNGEDVVQELAIDCYSPDSKIKCDFGRGTLEGFLSTLTRHRAIDVYRGKKRKAEVSVEDWTVYDQYVSVKSDNPSERMISQERAAMLDKALALFRKELKDDVQFECFMEHLEAKCLKSNKPWKKKDQKDEECDKLVISIARKLGTSVDNVYVIMHRHRKKLEKIAHEVLAEDERVAA